MKNILFHLTLSLLLISACGSNKEVERNTLKLEVKNPFNYTRQNTTILLNKDSLSNQFPNAQYYAVFSHEDELPSQLVNEGPNAGLLVLIDSIRGQGILELEVKPIDKAAVIKFKKRTQAELSVKEGGKWEDREYIGGSFKNVDELRVPDEHTDHSWYIRYEGPGWESDKVGYRFYLDWRNATDVFGKTTSEMVLQGVGLDGFDSYHEQSDWGMDILKVGKSLGVGSPAYFTEGRANRIDSTDSVHSKVLENGTIYSAIKTNYYGWEVADTRLDVTSYYGIQAGSRITHHHLDLTGKAENMATGIGKSEKAELMLSKGSSNAFGYLATYGKQSLNNDNLGLAVLFSSDQLMEITEDEYSHLVVLNPKENQVDYYFLAAWELEKEGIKTREEFENYLKQKAEELASPLQVTYSN